ncbi:ABC transporter B family member 4-like [Dorcoceras hygrometricum]|uniref:ABC transporter B family member 4-like n=1 Tax=Dorcoceras hygrometricum TaxID=472368 RepID=A0A2Z7CUM9_9LAMI|nr:ABC transporter B family member 4-like [Dorcoceras hygrometricum]
MRIRPPELETSICDAKYHVSLSTGVKLRSPIVEGLNCNFGLGGLKNCFHIIILSFGNYVDRSDQIVDRSYDEVTVIAAAPPPNSPLGRASTHSPPPTAARAVACRDRTCSNRLDEEIPFVSNLSDLLVQTDEGILIPIVDLIKENLPPSTLKCRIPCESGRSQAPRRQQGFPVQNFKLPLRPGKRDPDPTLRQQKSGRLALWRVFA